MRRDFSYKERLEIFEKKIELIGIIFQDIASFRLVSTFKKG